MTLATAARPVDFILGTHKAHWPSLPEADATWMLSRNTLSKVVNLKPALRPWVLDSGGFTELSKAPEGESRARWRITAREYVHEVARYAREMGMMKWAAPMDMMCEPAMIHGGKVGMVDVPGTGLSVGTHQTLTVWNFLELTEIWGEICPELPCPFIPVIQGWSPAEYKACKAMYRECGIDLKAYPAVGIGSVCRRQGSPGRLAVLFKDWADEGIRLHGFGVKTDGLELFIPGTFASIDSFSWSYDAYRNPPLAGHDKPGGIRTKGHATCSNCLDYALWWQRNITRRYQSESIAA